MSKKLTRLCEPLEIWLDEHRDPDETHEALLQLYFDIRAWLRVADTFDDHFVLQISAHGSEVRAAMLCLDPSDFLAADFAKGRAAVLFSATLAPAGYYRDLWFFGVVEGAFGKDGTVHAPGAVRKIMCLIEQKQIVPRCVKKAFQVHDGVKQVVVVPDDYITPQA